MFDYQIVDVKPGDIVLVDVNIERFDLDAISALFEQIQNALPSNTIIANPSKIVNGVTIFRQSSLDDGAARDISERGNLFDGNIY